MGLLLDIAWTHIRGRRRQTLISVIGVAMGTGFFIAISALMAGSDADFIERVVDATPHVTIRDEFRVPPRQPAERAYAGSAVALEGTKPKQELRGIRRARARMAAIDELPGIDAAPTLNGNAVVRYAGKDISAPVLGIEPARERHVSQIEEDMVAGSLESLFTSANGLIVGTGLAEMRERAEAVLDRLGIAERAHRRPDQISGGERQRAAIARALANDPAIVLADEPTGNLDTANAATVFDVLGRLAADEGRTVVAVTHAPEFASQAPRQIHIVDGRIVEDSGR